MYVEKRKYFGEFLKLNTKKLQEWKSMAFYRLEKKIHVIAGKRVSMVLYDRVIFKFIRLNLSRWRLLRGIIVFRFHGKWTTMELQVRKKRTFNVFILMRTKYFFEKLFQILGIHSNTCIFNLFMRKYGKEFNWILRKSNMHVKHHHFDLNVITSNLISKWFLRLKFS